MDFWYNNTVFYHMYPLGMSGAEMEQSGIEVNGLQRKKGQAKNLEG